MAGKESNDKSKTSKTARVMNLLSKKSELPPDETPSAETATAPEAKPAQPMLASLSDDAAVSGQIKNALEDALASELSPAAQPEPAPVRQEAAAPQSEPQPEPAAQVQSSQAPDPVPEEQHMGYINVMQVLVQEKATKYMQMFGLCTCKRCVQDVEALALNHLPPKYVVMAEHEMIPKLTFYEGKYSSDITAQLLQACKKVMATPHHNR